MLHFPSYPASPSPSPPSLVSLSPPPWELCEALPLQCAPDHKVLNQNLSKHVPAWDNTAMPATQDLSIVARHAKGLEHVFGAKDAALQLDWTDWIYIHVCCGLSWCLLVCQDP